MFQDEGDRKLVGFQVADPKGNNLAINRFVPKSGTNEEMIAAALEAAQPEIDEWLASFSVIGREWNADAGAFVAVPAAESSEVTE